MARSLQGLAGLVAVLLLFSAGAVRAQSASTASVGGTVRDASGGVLPGVSINATQTDTGLVRTAVTDESGAYLVTALPVGPYRLEFALSGFRTHVQTGIVLQVNTNPTVNVALELGDLSETVQVAGQPPLIETRSPGVGMVVDNQRVQELPLNGRQTLDLVYLTGLAAPSGTLSGARGGAAGPGSPGTIAVAGGLPNGTEYLLDGSNHNDPYNNGALPFPFPEALQEFKVETSALTAQYGYHSAAVVNAVTKSGTNTIHGSGFEFLRDDSMNARDPFAAIGADGKRRSDGLNRNQFGGSLGGPLVHDRLFYFAAYQRTRVRRTPTSSFQFMPTPAMLAGDFTAFASPQCQGGRQITLRAPFVNNRIDPAAYSPASLKAVSLLGATPDNPCGQVFFDRIDNSDEDLFTAKVDFNAGASHTIFGRLQYQKYSSPTNYDGKTAFSFSQSAFDNRVYSLALGDTVVLGNNTVNAFHATINRGNFGKQYSPLFDYSDLGVNATPVMADYMRLSVTGGFSIDGPGALPTLTPTWTYQFADDYSTVRGGHQFGLGVDYIHNKYDSSSLLAAGGNTTFTGGITGLGLADFLIGRAASFSAGTPTGVHVQNHYLGLYVQDNWRVSSKLTLNAGVRWDPYFPVYSAEGKFTRFDLDRFNQGLKSTVFPNAPAGLVFPGDDAMPGKSLAKSDLWNFSPRIGIVLDPQGEGRETLRASYGRLYDLPHLQQFTGQAQMAPWGNSSTVTNMPQGWDNPWVAVPGGDPIPAALNGPDKNSTFPLASNYTTFPLDLPATSTDQWNVSYQRQLAANWMASVNYLGNFINHVWWSDQINPAIYGPGASLANLNQRRVLFQQNPAEGQYYASVQEVRADGTSNYHGLMLQAQRRRANGFSLQSSYTISRCTTDRWNSGPGVDGFSVMIPGNREADRSKCANSPEHNMNASVVYEVPRVGSGVLRAVTQGWQVSGILSARSGGYYTVNIGSDVALSGQCCATSGAPQQRPNQVVPDPFAADRSYAHWLNAAAFQRPADGTYGTMPLDAIQAVARWNLDMGLSRSLGFAGNARQIQLRAEVFNVLNTVTPGDPQTTMSSADFGRVTSLAGGTAPRIIQLAIKYQF
jgi:hypothetical protein